MTPAEVAAEVLRRITDHPGTFDQRHWFMTQRREFSPEHIQPHETVTDWAECGTTACVAGHAAHVVGTARGSAVHADDIRRVAAAALGLADIAADWLFCEGLAKTDVVDRLTAIAAGRGIGL
ncbi:MAG: hypothetical protein OXG44_17420 [Gammaproteobacteria bacterium]|nr:hypothetical protein [Gammaproteobacteria bacterium]